MFVIDNDLRIITPPEGAPVLGVEHDANVNRLQFSMPRMYGEFDLSTFEARVNYRNANKELDAYIVTDANASEDHIEFSWLVGRHALQYKGKVQFIVCLRRMTADGEILQELNTTLAELPVLEGLEAELSYYEEETARDVIQQLLGLIDARGAEVLADISDRAPAIVQTVSGSIVSIKDGAVAPAVQFISHIEPVQAGSGDPSPDNVRPISGWDTAKVVGAGKNLFSCKDIKPLPYTMNGITFSDGGDGKIAISGTATATASMALINRGAGKRDSIKAGTYTVSGSANQTNATVYYVFYYDQEVAMTESFLTVQTSYGSPQKTFTLDHDCYYGCYISVVSGKTPAGYVTPQIEAGTAATDYEPYQAETLTADLPETVYGGSLDWTTGVLTVNKAKFIADGVNNKATNMYQTSGGVYYASFGLPESSIQTVNKPNNPLSDKFIAKSKIAAGNCYITGATNKTLIITPAEQTLTTVEAVNAWLVDNPTTFIYDLAEPYTIQLTPQQLTLLKGSNTVWSSTGDTELTYVADTKSYIDQKFAELQNAILAQGANI